MKEEKELEREAKRIHDLRHVLLSDKNIYILLYLAKYNPNVTTKDIAKHFGKESIEGLKDLIKFHLVEKHEDELSLTPEGIFHVKSLVMAVQ